MNVIITQYGQFYYVTIDGYVYKICSKLDRAQTIKSELEKSISEISN